jgi:hypothetical protein
LFAQLSAGLVGSYEAIASSDLLPNRRQASPDTLIRREVAPPMTKNGIIKT